ncbi:MAG TPA: hypothetical protein VHG29_08160 [Novosphingobium sp.]|nr:hypothetical protein [Novosphingobium sp.]
MAELLGNSDKIACFELYRRNVRSLEIITFDELFHRARCIVETICGERNREAQQPDPGVPPFAYDDDDEDDIPF